MKIKTKLTVLTLSIIVTMTFGFLLSFWSMNKLNRMSELEKSRERVDKALLQVELIQHNFIHFHSVNYLQSFERSMLDLLQYYEDLEQNVESFDELERTEELSSIKQLIKSVNLTFLLSVEIIEKVGLDEDSGLRGKLRNAAHRVENVLGQLNNHELSYHLLMLRRHEKDFLLRHHNQYIEKYEKEWDSLLRLFVNSPLTETDKKLAIAELTTYKNSFMELVENQKN